MAVGPRCRLTHRAAASAGPGGRTEMGRPSSHARKSRSNPPAVG
jgi:hypothetical protein